MSPELLTDLTIFLLSVLVGFAVISKVPATLHTPLMSAANAIHGVILVGAMVIGVSADTLVGYALALVAAVFAAMNVVGGYAVTDRMLQMFRRPGERAENSTPDSGTGAASPDTVEMARSGTTAPDTGTESHDGDVVQSKEGRS